MSNGYPAVHAVMLLLEMDILYSMYLFAVANNIFVGGQELGAPGSLSSSPKDFLGNLRSGIYSAVGRPLLNLQNTLRADLLWCGFRDVAPFPDAISANYPNVDSCCRSHDNCPIGLDRGECIGDICNDSFVFPILSCECEMAFRKCLVNLRTSSAEGNTLTGRRIYWSERILGDTMNFGYFRVFPELADRQCVAKTKPVIGCAANFFGRCTKMIYDSQAEPKWQLYRLKDVIRNEEMIA